MDIPHGRHAHKKPTPRGGGIAVVMSFFAVFLLFLLNIGSQISGTTSGNSSLNFTGFCISALLIVSLGIVDDRIELPSWIKLAVQVLAAGILCVFGNGFCSIMGYELPFWVNLILTELWCIGIINAFNLIDGLDGLASGLAAVSS